MPDNFPRAVGLFGDLFDPGDHVWRARGALGAQHFAAGGGIIGNGVQRLIDFVGQFRDHFAHHVDPHHVSQLRLMLPSLGLGLLAFGDVADNDLGRRQIAIQAGGRRHFDVDGTAVEPYHFLFLQGGGVPQLAQVVDAPLRGGMKQRIGQIEHGLANQLAGGVGSKQLQHRVVGEDDATGV